ncbi:hypothetical protein GAYE_SCF02G2203 [Galdieria yellowstonensis]|uniref:DNA replication licensing factor MCM2 n=1 Tax=Galdieria yellowstonensis TaxID=3028027 RepID=A0AAV9IA77_9RHOD|nr:hypothetical protein GAYE_SCF02G2203 [Galdieria yellowstonensis]
MSQGRNSPENSEGLEEGFGSAQDVNDSDRSYSSETEGEDLFGENMMDDYKSLEDWDYYEVDPEAEEEAAEATLDISTRRKAEREMEEREGRSNLAGDGLGGAKRLDNLERFQSIFDKYSKHQEHFEGDSVSSSEIPEGIKNMSENEKLVREEIFNEDDTDNDMETFTFEEEMGSLQDWLKMDKPRRAIKKRFLHLLKGCVDENTGAQHYLQKLRSMCAQNGQSLVVSYRHFYSNDPMLAVWLAESPTEILALFNEVATELTFKIFPQYRFIQPEIFVRISDMPICDSLRDIRQLHLNCLIKVSGVVTRRTGVFPQLKLIKLDCSKCGCVVTPMFSSSNKYPEKMVSHCPRCESKGPFTVNSEQTYYGNFQKMTLQESPGTVPAGRLPRYKEVILLGDLIDAARPGDEVEVTGVYKHSLNASLNVKNGFPVFATVIEANYVRKTENFRSEIELTDDDISEIHRLAEDPLISDRIVASIAPSIFGHENIKLALALALFGGQPKEVGQRHRIRGDINVLLLGDPGTAKSQFLKYVEKTAHRAVYTTGKGASAVGLTAAVHKDPVTREWTLEGGALVLADRGVCLIDEFDKMNDQDRTSIHEAMEQQSISISKAGIVTTLQARCSVIAAANPLKGRYDQSISFYENVDLSEPILSRFDILCVVKDVCDPVQDEVLAKFVVNSHYASHPGDKYKKTSIAKNETNISANSEGIQSIPQETLKKYILYARKYVNPKLNNIDQNKLERLYIDLRKESMGSGGMPIAVRHLESIIRLAEAHARLHLREYVKDEDLNRAIGVILESFFSAQKYSVMRSLRRTFSRYLSFRKDKNELLLHLLGTIFHEYALSFERKSDWEEPSGYMEIDVRDFESRASELGVQSCKYFYQSSLFSENGFSMDLDRRRICKRL